MEFADSRFHDEEHAGDSDPYRGEPPPSDRLAEKEDREQRDQHRREEDERIDLGERDGGESVGAQESRRDAADGAQHHPLRMVHAAHVAPALAARAQEEDHDRLEKGREEDDFGYRQLRPETLDDGIGAGKQAVGQEGEGDALQHGITGEEGHHSGKRATAAEKKSGSPPHG